MFQDRFRETRICYRCGVHLVPANSASCGYTCGLTFFGAAIGVLLLPLGPMLYRATLAFALGLFLGLVILARLGQWETVDPPEDRSAGST